MNDEELKKLKELIKGELREIKDLVEVIKHKVDTQQMFQSTASGNIRLMKEQQSIMNEKLGDIQKTQENHTGALMDIESRLEGFADAWKINKQRIERVEKHLGLSADAA